MIDNPAEQKEQMRSFGLTDVLIALRKRWHLMLVVFIVFASVGTYRAIKERYVYMASVKLAFYMPDPQILSNVGSSAFQYNQMQRPSFFATQQEIIKSAPVARRVAESLKLIKYPDNEAHVEGVINSIIGSISVSTPEYAQILIIQCTKGDPEMAMKVANATAEAYIRYNDNRRYHVYRKSMGALTEQLEDLKKKLEEAQKRLIDFIEKEKITQYGDNPRSLGSSNRITQEKDPRTFIENLNKQKVEAEIKMAKLLEKYYEAHPKVQAVKNNIKILNTKIAEEEKRLNRLKAVNDREIIEAKQKEIRYSILKRDVEVNKQAYDVLIRKLKETDIGSEMDTNFVDIIEYAKKPKFPISPNKKKKVIFSIFLGLVLGLGLGLALQYFDTSFKSADEVQSVLKYPLLSTVPLFKKKDRKTALLLDPEKADVTLKEAFRLLRTNLRFALSENPGKNIMVTSSQKGEGKSTVATNLGIVMSEVGSKVLLVDCDLRVRSINKLFGISSDVGLADYLSGGASMDDIVIKTVLNNLYIVPSGPVIDNPTVLFESERMKEFLKQADEKFDYVLLDSPPIGYVIDASLLSMISDGVVMVVEAGVVGRKAVQDAVDQVLKSKAAIYGIVFNKEASVKKSYYYKYYRYYPEDEKTV